MPVQQNFFNYPFPNVYSFVHGMRRCENDANDDVENEKRECRIKRGEEENIIIT